MTGRIRDRYPESTGGTAGSAAEDEMVLSIQRSRVEDEKRWEEERRRRRRREKDSGSRKEEELLRRRKTERRGLNQASGRGDHHSDGSQCFFRDGAGGTVQVGTGLRDGEPYERGMMRLLHGVQRA